jgi:hypothetical protein
MLRNFAFTCAGIAVVVAEEIAQTCFHYISKAAEYSYACHHDCDDKGQVGVEGV